MYQLNYRSVSKLDIAPKDIEDILTSAAKINLSKNITGCLVYHNNCFVQILEGDEKDVLAVFEKIQADYRHHGVLLLWENTVEKRYFSEWSMAYCCPEDKNSKQFINNFLMLSQLSERSSGSLISFWSSVRKIILGETISPIEAI